MSPASRIRLNTILRQAVAGVLLGIMGVTLVLSLITIIFRDDLSDDLARGTGWGLGGLVIIGAVTALTSSFRGLAAGPQDAPVVILAAVGATLVEQVEDPIATLAAFVILTSAVTGLLLVVMGRFGWGAHVRLMPYPVVAGFIGGTGVLLIAAGWDMITAAPAGSGRLALLVIPGLAVGLLVFALGRWLPESAAPVLVIAAAITGYHVSAAIADIGRTEGIERGFLLGPFPDGSLADLGVFTELWAADWGAILGQIPALGAMLVVVPIALLLTTGALERTFEVDIDENHELKSTGFAVLAAAPFAGFPGYAFMGDTVIGRRIGGAGRIPPLICAGMAAVVLVVGADLISLIPVAIPAGLLIAIGLDFVVTWVWDVRQRVGLLDYTVVLAIVATIALFGFLPGVGLGLAAATVLFVIRYSRVPSVRTIASMRERRSRVQRSASDEYALTEAGERTIVFELQGFVFFGTAERIVGTIRETMTARDGAEGFIIDLARVTGMDSSAVASFERLSRFADEHDLEMVLCGAGPETEPGLRSVIEGCEVPYEVDLDRALETKEEHLLVKADLQPPTDVDWGPIPTVALESGSVIIAEGEKGAGVYVLESGKAKVVSSEDESGSRQALLLPGSVIGELSHLSGGSATETVICETDCVVRHMSDEWLDELAVRDPGTALEINTAIARRLAVKLIAANRTIRSLE